MLHLNQNIMIRIILFYLSLFSCSQCHFKQKQQEIRRVKSLKLGKEHVQFFLQSTDQYLGLAFENDASIEDETYHFKYVDLSLKTPVVDKFESENHGIVRVEIPIVKLPPIKDGDNNVLAEIPILREKKKVLNPSEFYSPEQRPVIDNRKDVEKWALNLVSNPSYWNTYLKKTNIISLTGENDISYLNISVSKRIFLLTTSKKKYIMKALTTYEHLKEMLIAEALVNISCDYFPIIHWIVGLGDISYDEYPVLIMDYVPAKDMSHFYQCKRFKNMYEKFVLAQLVYALDLLHENLIVHRDIKLENILIDIGYRIKIIDFGYAKNIKSKDERLCGIAGTTGYMAPEIVRGSYSRKCDWFSLGIVAWIIMTRFKYQTSHFYKNQIANLDLITDTDAKDFVTKLVAPEQHRLCTFSEIKKHPYFQGFDWKSIEKHVK